MMVRTVMRIAGGAGCIVAPGLPIVLPEAAAYGGVVFVLSLALLASGILKWSE